MHDQLNYAARKAVSLAAAARGPRAAQEEQFIRERS